MKRQEMIHLIVGLMVLASGLLGYFHNTYWLFFTMFIGLNLFQSSITGFCGLDLILKKLGVEE